MNKDDSFNGDNKPLVKGLTNRNVYRSCKGTNCVSISSANIQQWDGLEKRRCLLSTRLME